MSSMSVVVFRNGKVLPNARVRLDGPGGTKYMTTNAAGNVRFDGLQEGTHIVNAAQGPDFLGVAQMYLQPGQAGIIHIKYPKPVPSTLTVRVVGGGGNARVVAQGPTFRSASASSGAAVFRGILPGTYTVQATALDFGNVLQRNSATVRVAPGTSQTVTIQLATPPSPPRGRVPYSWMTPTELKNRIRKLDAELEELSERIHRLDLDPIIERKFRNTPAKPIRNGLTSGEAANETVQNLDRKPHRRRQLERANKESAEKSAIKKALEDALILKSSKKVTP